ncbi:hypothetical protein M9H77_29988 [Catharanthus roseus]|uniref:Uncharacterized protein n=1 Tax=Catharanthus roseus TaxID=4058 RepID=A0ACB9ZZV7_CATRO|nr:hypothetical protein M9H77_29988 [Catharanthus roseus]
MLKDETGLGWNHNKQTINASYDWWKKKIQIFVGTVEEDTDNSDGENLMDNDEEISNALLAKLENIIH